MEAHCEDGLWRAGYPGEDADLIVEGGGRAYQHERDHRYWKIGICLPNLDLAYAQLRAAGVAVSEPRQFFDIGYMAHLTDPAGHVIELLQHDFEDKRAPGLGDPDLPLGGGAHLGQITLRTNDIAQEIIQYEAMGMRLMSVQDVAEFGFDLYFFAFSDEELPDPDPRAVANREWLWQRPYTTLEFQHLAGASLRDHPAYLGLEITGS
jgi:catechol 2,3-dioxygenase-like lactoylglutathione lyase family enzyme